MTTNNRLQRGGIIQAGRPDTRASWLQTCQPRDCCPHGHSGHSIGASLLHTHHWKQRTNQVLIVLLQAASLCGSFMGPAIGGVLADMSGLR